jgi:hypothetical protein
MSTVQASGQTLAINIGHGQIGGAEALKEPFDMDNRGMVKLTKNPGFIQKPFFSLGEFIFAKGIPRRDLSV